MFLAWAAPTVFNFEEAFRVGYYSADKDYRTTYSDGYGELNMDMQLERYRENRYNYHFSCHFSSGSSVEVVGLKKINYTINVGGSILDTQIINFNPPTEHFSLSSSALIEQSLSITWSGLADVQFISNSIVQNETIAFNLRVTITLSSQDYYNIRLIGYVVFFFWFLAFPLLPFILKAIFQPQFGIAYDEETKKKQKKYLDYFKEREEEQT